MMIRVKLFGSLREAAGAGELPIELPESARISELRAELARRYLTAEDEAVTARDAPERHTLRDGERPKPREGELDREANWIHDEWYLVAKPQSELQTVDAAALQPDVEHHDPRTAGGELRQGPVGVCGDGDPIAFVLQQTGDRLANIRLVIDDQHVDRHR